MRVVEADGSQVGVLLEDELRLGLAGKSRTHHSVLSLVRKDAPAPSAATAPRVKRALIMAGGRGSRLRPLTDATPKPLLPIDGEPLLHRLLRQVASAGLEDCWISTRYLAEAIEDDIGDGARFGLRVRYAREVDALGTAGALGLMEDAEDPDAALAVMNGDVYHDVNLRALFAWHARHGNAATVATQLHEVYVPFGLAHFDGQALERLEEKPTLRLPVNAGIYVFDEALRKDVPRGKAWDMVAWLNVLAAAGRVGQFPIVERWHDIGSLSEYRKLAGDEPA